MDFCGLSIINFGIKTFCSVQFIHDYWSTDDDDNDDCYQQ